MQYPDFACLFKQWDAHSVLCSQLQVMVRVMVSRSFFFFLCLAVKIIPPGVVTDAARMCGVEASGFKWKAEMRNMWC